MPANTHTQKKQEKSNTAEQYKCVNNQKLRNKNLSRITTTLT